MTLSVYLLRPPDPEPLATLREKLSPDVELVLGPDLPEPATYQVLVAGRPQREHVTASPCLHTLIIPWSGMPEETRSLMLDFPGVSVHNLHHNAEPVAELALALLLAAAKFVVPLDQALRRHDWTFRYEPPPTALLHGKTALILGYGAIGRRLAQACRALGMSVAATRRSAAVRYEEEGVAIHPAAALPELLPRADALIVTLPLTPETEGLLGEAELALLPEGAVLVNVGRGTIVEQEALYEALHRRRLRAAGLDVWYNYPPDAESRTDTAPADYPFPELENVVMSPHRGGSTDETGRLRMAHLARLLNAIARGVEPPNRVDVAAGY
ncbi:MAG: NAD(P)-dependent oxidoreductase [Candidatus Promineifilaceae bacterium]|nr:NAD(P)-dependent oxidoreductase [Candidatus Promineifilaceae bacterium]